MECYDDWGAVLYRVQFNDGSGVEAVFHSASTGLKPCSPFHIAAERRDDDRGELCP